MTPKTFAAAEKPDESTTCDDPLGSWRSATTRRNA